MRRAFLTCLSAIALLSATSVAVILWATRDVPPAPAVAPPLERPETETETAAAGARPQQPDTGAGSEPGLDGLGVVPLPPAPGTPAPPRVASFATPEPPRRGAAHRVPAPVTGNRRATLAGVRRGLMTGMAALQRRVAGCSLAGATLSLSVETVDGGVRVVNARLESRGASTDEGEACARAALTGQLIRAPGMAPGQRWQLPLAVHPG